MFAKCERVAYACELALFPQTSGFTWSNYWAHYRIVLSNPFTIREPKYWGYALQCPAYRITYQPNLASILVIPAYESSEILGVT